MTFKEALQRLNIVDYSERIFNSNSHGECFHLADYIAIAELDEDLSWFREWFMKVVAIAEERWSRPESVFQHIRRILIHNMS